MQCERAQMLLNEARYGAEASPELREHVASCPACRVVARRDVDLDRVLARLPSMEPGPGFDTRFFARLDDEKKRTRRSRYVPALWALLPLAAAAAVFLVRTRPVKPPVSVPPREALALTRDLELVQNLDVLRNLDELQDYQLLDQLDDRDLSRLAEEPK